jgi:hypothetical protein
MNGEHMECLMDGRCPDCLGFIWRLGPRGGIAQNIECVQCRSRFNVARYEGEFVTAQRIPSEANGGGTWREDMFPKVLE